MDERHRPQNGQASGGDQPATGTPATASPSNARATTISVAVSDSLADVLERLSASPRGAARIAIPPGSALFLTASEFRALKETSDQAGIDTTIETEDPLRRQLATMFGLRAVQVGAPPGPRPLPSSQPAAPPGTLPPPTPLIPRGGNPAAPRALTPPHAENDAPSVRRSPLRRHRRPPELGNDAARTETWNPGSVPSQGGSAPAAPVLPPRPVFAPGTTNEVPAGRPGRSRRTILIALAVLLAVALLIAAALAVAAMTLTSTDVVVELRQQPVATESTFRIVADGGVDPGGEIAIPGRFVTLDVTVEQTVPATGAANVGVSPATGVVQLANPGDSPVEIPAGTSGVGDTGLEFRFVSDVTVPEAVDDAPGQADAEIEAVTLGTVGNLGPGELSGVLDSGVFFSNRLAELTGGADRSGTVVSESDLEAASAAAAAAAPAVAEDRFAQTLQSEVTPVPSTFRIDEPRETFDRAAGEAADGVTVRATFTVTALTYAESDLDALVRERIVQDLGTNVPAGFALDESTVRIATPEAVAGTSDDETGIVVSVRVSGRASAALTDADAAALADRLAGQSDAGAEETIRANPAIETFSIRHSPGWLARGMPDDADRIEIRVDE